jgi:hypothetical protein
LLFPGGSQQSRFTKCFNGALKENAAELGIVSKDIGAHSLRKGAATFVGGAVDGPSSITVCLRAGWKMGGVQDRYFRYERGGDQYTGRIVSGLDMRTPEFAVLPPHFPPDQVNAMVAEMAKSQFPSLRNHSILPLYLLASLVYHSNYLISNLCSSHPIFSTSLFLVGNLEDLRNRVAIHSVSPNDLRPTGVPAFTNIISAISAVPQQLETVIADKDLSNNFITKDFFASALKEVVDELKASRQVAVNETHDGDTSGVMRSPVYTWDGKLKRLPKDYKLPKTTLLGACIVWHYGDKNNKIAPIKTMSASDFSICNERRRFAEWRDIFQRCEEIMVFTSDMQASEYVSNILPKLLPERTEKGRFRRFGEIKICSVSRIIRKK